MTRVLTLLAAFAATLLAAAGLVVLTAGPAAAAGVTPPNGYGATAPAQNLPVGLAGTVIVTRTVGPAGGVLTGTLDGRTITATVPPGASTTPLQVTLSTVSTETVRGGLTARGHDDLRVLTGVTLTVTRADGTPVKGDLAKPITVTISGGDIGGEGQQLLVYASPPRLVTGGLSQGQAARGFAHSGALVVLAPRPQVAETAGTAANRSGGPATVSGTALPRTGSDTAAYAQLAALLVAVGVGLLVLARGWRRRRTQGE